MRPGAGNPFKTLASKPPEEIAPTRNRTFARLGLALGVLYLTSETGRSLVWHDAPRGNRVDKLFAQWDKPDSPGCALAIVKDAQ